MTVRPSDSAAANRGSRGTSAITSTPVASEKARTASLSESPPRELKTMPRSLGLPASKLRIPFIILFAAYRDMNSPDVTMTTASAFSRLNGTAKPPHTTSPRTSYIL